MRLRMVLVGLVLAVVAGCSEAGGQEVVNGRLGRKIQGIVASKKLQGARIGVKVYSTTDKEVVYQRDADTAFSVASNMKIATTAVALVKLGQDHRLKATLYRCGEIICGVLKGHLLVTGRGDPNISGRFHGGKAETVLDSWAGALKSLGIDRVEGPIIVDGTGYGSETIPPGWPQNQLEKWYCAPVSALSVNDNCYDVTVKPGSAEGKPAIVTIRPRAGVTKLVNQCTTTSSKSKHLIAISRRAGTNEVTVKGAFWSRSQPQAFNITMHNPPLVFGSALAGALERQGIDLGGGVRLAKEAVDREGMVPVVEHSTLLATAIAVTNKRSQNVHAEILLRELGRISGRGTRDDGIKELREFLTSIGVPKDEVSPADGCGLDRNSRMSPSAIVTLLAYMRSRPDFLVFKESLAVSGTDGTLENRLKEKGLEGRVHAKTGYIRGVSALSGYALSRSGKEFAFSIVFNNAGRLSNTFMKSIQDEIARAVLESD